MRFRGLTVKGLIVFGVLASSLVFGGVPAFGVFVHEYESQITGTPTGPGGETVPFAHAWGLAFDASNNLFVADANGKIVDRFDSTNTFTGQIGALEFPQEYTRSVAVNDTTGVVYVAESGPEEIFVFKPEGGKYTLIQKRKFGGYMYVAVNNSTGPHAGDVYVIAQGTIHVIKPESNGEIVEAGVELSPPTEGFSLLDQNSSNGGLAIDPTTGTVYVANPGHQTVDEYNSENIPQAAKLTLPGAFEPVSVAIDPSNGEVYTLDAANRIVDEFSNTGAFLGHIKGTTSPFGNPGAVAVKQNAGPGDVYVTDGAAVDIFGPDVEGIGPEKPVTEPASAITATTAVLHGELNPSSNTKTGWYFAYNKGNSCQGATTTPLQPVVEGQAVKESTEVTGLEPSTEYAYCMIAENEIGREYATPVTFTTEALRPRVQIERTSNITAGEAAITASVNPEQQLTTCRIEYGETTSYGQQTPCEPANLGNGAGTVWATATLTGLNANTTYHYRLLATYAAGTIYGTDQQFATFPAPPPTKNPGEDSENPTLPATVIASFTEVTPQPLLTLPPIAFPTDEARSTTPKGLTNAQKLANALKACHARHNKKKRGACETRARKRYPLAKSKRGKK